MINNQMTVGTPKELMDYLRTARNQVALALPKHLNADRMLRLAVTCFSTTPKLRSCEPKSILSSIIVASQIGLEPGIAGQGYLIPYKRTCTFVPGWQGLVGLLNNSGRATAWTGAVFEGDEWDFCLGSLPKCKHVPGPNFGDAAKMTWVYACGKVNGSEQPVIEAWPISRVWAHRDKFNKVGKDHYSFANPEMYARKVVLLQVLKYMPRSIELNNALVASDASESGRRVEVQDGVIVDLEPHREPSQTDDEAAEAAAGLAPEAVRNTPQEEPPARKATPQEQLSDLVIRDAGSNFDAFRKWVDDTQDVKGADAWAGFDDVPTEFAERVLNARSGLVRILKASSKKAAQ